MRSAAWMRFARTRWSGPAKGLAFPARSMTPTVGMPRPPPPPPPPPHRRPATGAVATGPAARSGPFGWGAGIGAVASAGALRFRPDFPELLEEFREEGRGFPALQLVVTAGCTASLLQASRVSARRSVRASSRPASRGSKR